MKARKLIDLITGFKNNSHQSIGEQQIFDNNIVYYRLLWFLEVVNFSHFLDVF